MSDNIKKLIEIVHDIETEQIDAELLAENPPDPTCADCANCVKFATGTELFTRAEQKRAQVEQWMDQAIEHSKYPEMLADLKAQLRTAELEIQRQAILLAPLPEVPDREFDNGGDIERDMMRPEWRAFDQVVADADPERLRVALMVLNSVLSTRDREMAVRVMKNETQTDVENREMDAELLAAHPQQEVDDADVR